MDKKVKHSQRLLTEFKNYNDEYNDLTIILKNGRFRVSKLLFLLSRSSFMVEILQDLDDDAMPFNNEAMPFQEVMPFYHEAMPFHHKAMPFHHKAMPFNIQS